MKLFISYLKLHYKSILLFLLFSAVFTSVFLLYSLPMDAVLYSCGVCLFIGIIIFSVSFVVFRKKHFELVDMADRIKISLENMPEPANIIEEDYTEIVKSAFAEKCKAQSNEAMKISEMTDYYTLWAHQIKTPISAMRIILQSSEHSAENEEIENQLFKIEQYVDMVLNYIKSDTNANDYVLKHYDLDSVIKSVLRKYASQFIRKKISLNYDGVSLNVLTDEKWLSFVIGQIISNSIKYTNEGSISIYLEGKSVLVIEDTGIGIAPEDLPRVCEKGYTGYNGRADKKSTGIGLYLCKRVLNNLSHKLYITSKVGKGTTVKIEFLCEDMFFE